MEKHANLENDEKPNLTHKTREKPMKMHHESGRNRSIDRVKMTPINYPTLRLLLVLK